MSDFWMLAAEADGVLLVVDAGRTSTEAVRDAKDQLEQAEARLIGTVLIGSPGQDGSARS
jgi:Mrp family chromosome partitioning ATPase